MANKLKTFMYLLLRDHLTVGTVEGIMLKLSDEEMTYESVHLEGLAEDYATSLSGDVWIAMSEDIVPGDVVRLAKGDQRSMTVKHVKYRDYYQQFPDSAPISNPVKCQWFDGQMQLHEVVFSADDLEVNISKRDIAPKYGERHAPQTFTAYVYHRLAVICGWPDLARLGWCCVCGARRNAYGIWILLPLAAKSAILC